MAPDMTEHGNAQGPRPVNIVVPSIQIPGAPAPSEIESRLQPSFHDSGLGSSRPSGPSLVPPPSVSALSVSTAFSLISTSGNRPSVPRMPKGFWLKDWIQLPNMLA